MLAQLPSSNDAGSSEWSTVTLEARSVSETDGLEHVVAEEHLHQVCLNTSCKTISFCFGGIYKANVQA
jgi:lipoate synthase